MVFLVLLIASTLVWYLYLPQVDEYVMESTKGVGYCSDEFKELVETGVVTVRGTRRKMETDVQERRERKNSFDGGLTRGRYVTCRCQRRDRATQNLDAEGTNCKSMYLIKTINKSVRRKSRQ